MVVVSLAFVKFETSWITSRKTLTKSKKNIEKSEFHFISALPFFTSFTFFQSVLLSLLLSAIVWVSLRLFVITYFRSLRRQKIILAFCVQLLWLSCRRQNKFSSCTMASTVTLNSPGKIKWNVSCSRRWKGRCQWKCLSVSAHCSTTKRKSDSWVIVFCTQIQKRWAHVIDSFQVHESSLFFRWRLSLILALICHTRVRAHTRMIFIHSNVDVSQRLKKKSEEFSSVHCWS